MMEGLIRKSLIPLMSSLLAACGSTPPTIDNLQVDDNPRIVLGFAGDPPEFQILRQGSTKCPNGSRRAGCIDSPTGKAVIAKFELRDSPDWRFSRFEICSGAVKPEPGACKLRVFERLEFGAYAKKKGPIRVPSAKGIIRLERLGDKLDTFFVANQNSFKADYYYRVEVCHVSERDKCVWNEDPAWVNRGRY